MKLDQSANPAETRNYSPPPSSKVTVPAHSMRRCTTSNTVGFKTAGVNALFKPTNSSPHFVCIQENGLAASNNHSQQSLSTPQHTYLDNHASFATGKNKMAVATKEKRSQRRNSFFGSLFNNGSGKNLSSSNLLLQQVNGHVSSPQNDINTFARTNGNLAQIDTLNRLPSNQNNSSRSSGIWMQNASRELSNTSHNSTNTLRDLSSSGRKFSAYTANSTLGDTGRQRSVSSTLSTNRTVLELRQVMEHRPSSAREAALETFAVIAKKRICVVRKFGSHMDNHITSLLDGLGRNADTEATYLTVDQQTGAEILSVVQRPGLPLVFINGDCIGGISELRRLYQNGFLAEALKPHDYDLVVLGGDSGGISAAMEAAALGKRVACVDDFYTDGSATVNYVNVSRIPKKLMQQAAMVGTVLCKAKQFGWLLGDVEPQFDWSIIRQTIQQHVQKLNARKEKELTAANIDYIKAFGKFSGSHSLTLRMMVDNSEREITTDRFMIAVELRSKLPNLKNAKDCCIGSEDLFTLPHNPGQTLCISDSFISLEIAGFLAALGNKVTVLLRSSRIRGLDEDNAERLQKYLTSCGVRFLSGVITSLNRLKESSESDAGVVAVSLELSLPDGSTEELKAEFNTVICAANREPNTQSLNFSKPNIKLSATGKILSRHEQSQTAAHVYAVGDILEGAVEFSQVSSTAAQLLMRRLYTGSMTHTDYESVMTSVLTPLEYCACGFTEYEAKQHYGAKAIAVYEAPICAQDACVDLGESYDYTTCKALFLKSEHERLIGFQILGPHAAEIATGFAMAMKLNAHRSDFQDLVGVSPSAAEAFSKLQIKSTSPRKASY